MTRNYRGTEHEDNRNYAAEARNLVAGLKGDQLYEMYKIVNSQLQRGNSETRDKELKAVKSAIEKVNGIDRHRLKHIITGYKSSMADGANPRDGHSKPNKKKA
jgi:hypothetical protein